MNFFLNDKLKLSGQPWFGNEEQFNEIIVELCKILESFNFHIDANIYYSSVGMAGLMKNFEEIDEITDGVYSDNINAVRSLIEEVNAIDWTKNKVQRNDVLYFHQLHQGLSTQSVNDTTLAEACEFKFNEKKTSIINLKHSEYDENTIRINRSLINPPNDMNIVAIVIANLKQEVIGIIVSNRNRIYNHNPKHGENNMGKHRGDDISPLECSIDEAAALLKFAVSTREKNELYVFDEKHDKYLVYKMDAENSYHGYHPINQNEIPSKVKEFLSLIN